MTKKELKEYIKEMILKEVSQEDVESAKELNKELEKTKKLSDELGLTKENKKKNSEEKLDFTIKELVRLRKELKSNQNQLSKIITDENKKEEADDLSVKINNIKKQIKELETLKFQLEK